MNERLANWLVNHSVALIFTSLCLLVAMGMGLIRLELESGNRVFFSAEDPNLRAELEIEDIYGKSDNILIVLQAPEGSMLTPKNLSLLEDLTHAAWQVPHSTRVDSITNFQHPSVDGDDIYVSDLVEDASRLSAKQLSTIQQIALSEKALVSRLVSKEGNVAAINITLNLPEDGFSQAVREAVGHVRSMKERLSRERPEIAVYLSGIAVTEQTLADVTLTDATMLIPIVFAVVLFLLGILTRSVAASVSTLLLVLLSIIIGMGGAGWLGIAINSVNVSAPTIIMTLAVADCVHVFSVYLRNLGSLDKKSALIKSLSHTIYPIFLTSVTTALGFLSMTFSESPPFQQLGIISAIGVIGAFCLTLTVLPQLILWLPAKADVPVKREKFAWDKLVALINNYNQPIFTGTIALSGLAMVSVATLELNDDPIGYFSKEVPLTKAMNFIEEELSGTQQLKFSLDSGSPNGALDPVFLAQADDFANWLIEQPEVVNVDVFTETLRRLNQVMHGGEVDRYTLPDNRALAAQYTLLYEMSVPYGLDPGNRISGDKARILVSVVTSNLKSDGLIKFEKRSRDWLRQHAPALETRGASQSLSFAHIGQRNIESMFYGAIFAVAVVCIALALAFMSLRYGVISLIPNLLPAFLTLGAWGLFVGEVNMAASVVFSLTLGIIVDDTTHLLVHYSHARREQQLPPIEAIVEAYQQVGAALVTTTIVLASGFSLLLFSNFMVNATSGILVATTVVVALVLDMVFLPTVLLRADKWLHKP